MWMKFRRVFTALVSLLLPLPFANACGVSYLEEDYRVALLNPYVAGAHWSPFFYSAEYLNHYANDKNGNDRRRNCEEWAAYAGTGVTATDVYAVVYGSTFDDLLNAVAEKEKHERLGQNLFLKMLLNPEKKPASTTSF